MHELGRFLMFHGYLFHIFVQTFPKRPICALLGLSLVTGVVYLAVLGRSKEASHEQQG